MIYRDQGNATNAKSSFQTAEVNPDFFDGYIALGLALAAENDTLPLGITPRPWSSIPTAWKPANLAYFLQNASPRLGLSCFVPWACTATS